MAQREYFALPCWTGETSPRPSTRGSTATALATASSTPCEACTKGANTSVRTFFRAEQMVVDGSSQYALFWPFLEGVPGPRFLSQDCNDYDAVMTALR